MATKTAPTVMEILQKGIGSNFTVLNPEDGYRKDNSLWFGECSVCGERVSNSKHSNKWMHSEVLSIKYHADGKTVLSRTTRELDQCPVIILGE